MPEPEPELMTYGQLVEAYVAVREELDRLRAERDALRAKIERAREIAHSYQHEIGAATVFDVLDAALGSTPDTGSTDEPA